MWKNKGDEGFERDIDNQFECAKYLAQLVQEREGFELILEVRKCFLFPRFLILLKLLKKKKICNNARRKSKCIFLVFCSLSAPTCVSTIFPRDCGVQKELQSGGMKSPRWGQKSRREWWRQAPWWSVTSLMVTLSISSGWSSQIWTLWKVTWILSLMKLIG